MIKSFPELNTQTLFLLFEENPLSDVYLQVKLTDEQFEAISKIVNKQEDGFLVDCFQDRYIVSDYVDTEEE